MLSLDLTEGETEQLVKAIDRSLKDAAYHCRYWEEKHSKTLMDKIVTAIIAEQQAKAALEAEEEDDEEVDFHGIMF